MAYDFTTLPDRWNAGAFKYEHMKEKISGPARGGGGPENIPR